MTKFLPSELVNVYGQPWSPSPESLACPIKKAFERGEYHKGWRVVGLPPGSEDDAREMYATKLRLAESEGRTIGEFELATWLSKLRLRPVRSKPYEIRAAADRCRDLAERAGWINVEVQEIKRAAS